MSCSHDKKIAQNQQNFRFLLQTVAMHTFSLPPFARTPLLICIGLLFTPLISLAQNSPPTTAKALADDTDAPIPTSPTAVRLTYETFTLPGREKMGMLGMYALTDVAENVSLGLASFGALRGERGGFITLGVAGEVRKRISPRWQAHAGLYVGAGGGRGGFTLAGGGLMLRADAGLKYQTNGYGNVGFGISHVNFPSGVIRSTQPYVMYEYPFYSLIASNGSKAGGGSKTRSSLSSKEQEFAVVARHFKIPSSVVRDDGSPQHPSMQLAGVEWLSYLDDRWFLKIESEGAAGGQNNGYMQILMGGGYRLPITKSTSFKVHAAAGPAGGGGADTGGGLLLDAGIGIHQKIFGNNALELSVSQVRAPSRSFKATSVGLKLVHSFGLPQVGAKAVSASALAGFEPAALRARFAHQTYSGASPNWRTRTPEQNVGNLGVQLDYFLTPNWFLSGQGLAAYSGNAGAYMKGLVGAGYRQPITGPWFVEAEALVGAAGGGGVAVGGGLVAQGNASVGYQLNKSLAVMATAGRIQAARGDFKANVLGVSLGYQFNLFTAP